VRAAGAWLRPRLRRRRTGVLAIVIVVAILLATLLPPLVTLAGALNDYRQLSALGSSGLHHLLAAKDDLSGLSGLDQIQKLLQPQADATPNGAYNYLMQRQSGTAYAASVTVHPAPKMAGAGVKDQRFATTLDKNTLFSYDVPPAPATPTPTPAPSPTPTASPTPSGGAHLSNAQAIAAAVTELRGAQKDFGDLRSKLNNPDWVLNAAGTIPGTKTRLTSVRALADVGYDISSLGLEFANAFQPILGRIEQGALSSQTDLVTPTDLTAIQQAFAHATSYLDDIQSRLANVDLSQLPLTTQQVATFNTAIAQLPHIRDVLGQVTPWVTPVGWLLGVGQSRHFLVQTLDRSELRPSGGFTGNFGVLTITNGKLEPFSLKNINDLDYNGNGWIYGKRAPVQYSWWPIGNFGLRDSNLSADFPTTAKMNIDIFRNEGGGDVDGVIQFTTTAIAHVLTVTGPIVVPNFNETVTADNLEAKIHYYEEDPAGIAKQQQLYPDDHSFSLRKRFTQLVTQLLEDKVKHLPQSQLVPLAQLIYSDLKGKDLQIYVTNQPIEDELLKVRAGGATDTRSGLDGMFMVEANVSVAKSNPNVIISEDDDVTLDDQGGASHRLTITFAHRPTVPYYSIYTTFQEYIRIYTPPQARLDRGTGFKSGNPLCWAPPASDPGAAEPAAFGAVPYCPSDPFPDGELVCPPGGYGPGLVGNTPSVYWVLDALGPPTQTTSDVPGRTMWGGFILVPQNCTAKVTLRWYVPNIAKV
jgi:hypothetical protein